MSYRVISVWEISRPQRNICFNFDGKRGMEKQTRTASGLAQIEQTEVKREKWCDILQLKRNVHTFRRCWVFIESTLVALHFLRHFRTSSGAICIQCAFDRESVKHSNAKEQHSSAFCLYWRDSTRWINILLASCVSHSSCGELRAVQLRTNKKKWINARTKARKTPSAILKWIELDPKSVRLLLDASLLRPISESLGNRFRSKVISFVFSVW